MADFDFSTLITDRAPADLEALRDLLATPMADWTAEQLAAFNQAASKGAYNYTDLNRVIAAMDDINERLTAAGYMTGYQRIVVPHQGNGGSDILPDGYTQLEYIKSSGSQYIDTQVIATSDLKLEMTGNIEPYSANLAFFGARTQVNSNDPTANLLLALAAGTVRSDYYGSSNTVEGTIQGEFAIVRDKNQTTINGLNLTNSVSTRSSNRSLYLFAVNTNGVATLPASMQLNTCRIYLNGLIVRNYIPCIDPNQKIGMYDSVEEKFYSSVGSGEFIAGLKAKNGDRHTLFSTEPYTVEEEPSMDPYTWYEKDNPTEQILKGYLDNLNALRVILPIPKSTVESPDSYQRLSYQDANDIEEILQVIGLYLETYLSILIRSNMPWAISDGPAFYFVN